VISYHANSFMSPCAESTPKKPTHRLGGQLDFVINQTDQEELFTSVINTGLSDHSLLLFRNPFHRPRLNLPSYIGRSWKNFSDNAFKNDLLDSELCRITEDCQSRDLDSLVRLTLSLFKDHFLTSQNLQKMYALSHHQT
jgi:hypothetical protein